MNKIAVIGLGNMGTPIATFLLKKGYEVTGYDIVKEKMNALARLGLTKTGSPKEAASAVELVITSLPNWHVVEEVVEGKRGILEGAGRGLIICESSTVPPWETKAMGERLKKKGIIWMDTPISGSQAQAREGNMVFMVGGDEKVFQKIKPVLDDIGKKTLYAGPSGTGAQLKLVVNQTLFLNQASAIEGMVLGLKAGLNPHAMWEALVSGAAGSNLIEARGKDMLRGDFTAKGSAWISVKDMGTALESARRLGVVLPVTALYYQMMLTLMFNDWGDEDSTAVMRVYEELAGIKRKKPSRRATR